MEKDLLADYYANADVFIHPNPREPFGIAPLEAMASGVPTVAPRSGGILSYAGNDNAWLVEANGEAFAAAIREAVNDPELAKRKTAKALQTARENTREHSTDNLLATYDKLFDDFQARRSLFTDLDAAKKFDYRDLIK
jgi:glycosyltransferase involved in cell wall biosynthesis